MHNSFTYRRTRRMFLAAATGALTMQLILVGAAFGQTWNDRGWRGLLRRIQSNYDKPLSETQSGGPNPVRLTLIPKNTVKL